MIRKLRIWLMRVWRWYRHRRLYVILDAADNSVTLSRDLFEHMDVTNQEQAKVFVFRLAGRNEYAFMLNPKLEQETQLADIQYNSKHRTIGFECLCPTVNRIFYDYSLPANITAKLSVEPATVPSDSPEGKSYYIILPPHAKPDK